MDLLGERLTTRRLHTPTSGEWVAGEYVDAGLAMIVSSNLAHRQRESTRQLVTALGPGTFSNGVRGYTVLGTPLDDSPDPGSYDGVTEIAWDWQTALRFGPLYLLGDRDVTDEPPTWRTIRVSLDVSATSATYYAAITTLGELPSTTALAFAESTSTAGRTRLTLDLSPSRDLVPTPLTCRRPDGSAPEQSLVAQVNLWVGWYGTSGTNSLWTISAFEVR